MTTAPAGTALDALGRWELVIWLKTSTYAYPGLEVMHLAGMGLLFGSIFIVDLRLLGLLGEFDANRLAKHILPWTLTGFAVAVFAGLSLLLARMDDMIANPAFVLKMVLLFAAATNAGVLHARGPLNPHNHWSRLQAVLSIGIWLAIIACGRWIAYV